jgi:hypothetical protein
MKIEIDLNDIFGDPENGVESIQDSVKRQVISALTEIVQKGIRSQIDQEVATVISETIKTNIQSLTPKLFDDLMSAEYTPVDRYGDRERGKTTTFRKEMVKKINEEMVYKKTTYDSDKNAFTKAVDSVLSEQVASFKKQYNSLLNEMFTKECFAYAQFELQRKLGVK